jgi:hypothetical protein
MLARARMLISCVEWALKILLGPQFIERNAHVHILIPTQDAMEADEPRILTSPGAHAASQAAPSSDETGTAELPAPAGTSDANEPHETGGGPATEPIHPCVRHGVARNGQPFSIGTVTASPFPLAQ